MNNQERNKRLGQYFTGQELAKVLCAIAFKINPKICSAIDPMMGKGDMLTAVNEIDNSVSTYGVELDKQLDCKLNPNVATKSNIVYGSSFEKKTHKILKNRLFDLVITNPPYVRHLNQKFEYQFEDFTAGSNLQIRNQLIESLIENPEIKKYEKAFLLDIAKKYSGLSDLTVPSIIQCAAFTKENGVLALVLPESCITREYSIATLLVLFKLFNIKFIVKDEGRKWFENAQVKTVLLIGQKLKEPRKLIESHPKISIVEIYDGTKSDPLGKNSFTSNYDLFASTLVDSEDDLNNYNNVTQYFSTVNSYLSPLASKNLLKKYPELKTIALGIKNSKSKLDTRLRSSVDYNNFIKLSDLSIEINQGLRTGANNFFYYDFISEKNNKSKVYFNYKSISKILKINSNCLKTVLRKQKEISDGYFIPSASLKGRLLVLNNHYTAFDIEKYNLKNETVTKLSIEVSKHIYYCETLNIGNINSPKYFPELSAVRTNISERDGEIKTWYQLPKLKNRHVPDICIPRVNTKSVKSYLVEENVVVDANFLTINIKQDSNLSVHGLIAILNSDWIKVQLELRGNVLGGGALKLDRNHLLNILIPKFTNEEIIELDELGKELVKSLNNEQVLVKINKFVNLILKISDNAILKKLIEKRFKSRSKNG
ncbi:N-6 DNA methylase [Leeuwenhoekiella sp. H156]|uniref:N-6 DNA methylase n=1 Tax=Leeuwenhoekiella sp. H156 TaxID=3450128 RepID=UPI003FA454DD